MEREDRMLQLETALKKLQASEINLNNVIKKYTALESTLNKGLNIKVAENLLNPHNVKTLSSVRQSISGSTVTVNSTKSKKEEQHKSVKKRIFQVHDEVALINEINSKGDSKKNMFLNALDKTNSIAWNSSATKYQISKLESRMSFSS